MSLEIKNLSVAYETDSGFLQALEDISISIPPGTCLGLVGESGSGKTTLGLACLGLLPKNARVQGHIEVEGREVSGLNEAAWNEIRWKKVGMVFQNGAASLNPVHRVVDQVAEPLIHRQGFGGSSAAEKAALQLRAFDIDSEQMNRYPHELSGGEIQRILLAMATILDPPIIVLDEPTASLDTLSKQFFGRFLEQSKRQNKSLLLITHDLELAASFADSISVLYLGQIMETLPGPHLLNSPLHPYTWGLVRSFPTLSTTRELGGIRGEAFFRHHHEHEHRGEKRHAHAHVHTPVASHYHSHGSTNRCLFEPRCTQAIEVCGKQKPEFEPVGDHSLRCHRKGIASMVELHGIEKRYGKTLALEETDLTLREGEVVALVGETGSGKTTLAMISGGILEPSRGKRIFRGRDMGELLRQDRKEVARQVGIVYQSPTESISHRLTVFETMVEPLRIHNLLGSQDETMERILKVFEEVHLPMEGSFLTRYPHELSGGEVQRISIARALILGPSLLIADEPTSSLDPSVQAKVLKLLLHLQTERGLAMLFVTHNMGLARKVSDRMVVMYHGRIVEEGPSHLIFSQPLHPYTRLLTNSASCKAENPSQKNREDEQVMKGCRFYTRCNRFRNVCTEQIPSLITVAYRKVRCFFPLGYEQ